ncbi:MAG: leucine-rich repeat domain-containing protein [Gammaproteobacteria bacterium]|nr:leucine-rich repeat domain-containing protein [Gammaproteobacteria bacterium]
MQENADVYSFWPDEDHLNIPRIIKESPYPNHGIVFIYGIERRNFRGRILQYINIGREFLSESKAPLVFWTTAEMVADISNRARDLWAFRSGLFEFREKDFGETTPLSLAEQLRIIEQTAKTGTSSLNLHNTGLTELSPKIGLLTGLTALDLSENQLTALPPEIGLLTKLELLDLSSNLLATLPPEIGLIKNLEQLEVKNNPLKFDALRFFEEGTLQFQRVTAFINGLGRQVNDPPAGMKGSQNESLQRESTGIFQHKQQSMESHCPNIFVIRPRYGKGWLRRVLDQKMMLQLYCQAPGCWHPLREGGGVYEISDAAAQLPTMAPYIRIMIQALKSVTPQIGFWADTSSRDYERIVMRDIELTEELAERLSGIEYPDGLAEQRLGTEGAILRALRALRVFLDEQDQQHDWGGLKKILTPEGDYLWLCEEHAKMSRFKLETA